MIHVIAFLSKDIIFKRRNTFPFSQARSLIVYNYEKRKHLLGGFKIDFVISLNQVGHITE